MPHVILLSLVLVVVSAALASACAVGPRTYHFRESPLAVWQTMGRMGTFTFFAGRIESVDPVKAGNHHRRIVTVDVEKVLGGEPLPPKVVAEAFFGNFPGGCGEMVRSYERGSFVVQLLNGAYLLRSH